MSQAEAGHLREEHEENPAEPHANSKEWTAAEKAAAQAQLEGEWGDVTVKRAKLASETGRRQAEIATARAVVGKLGTTVPLAQARETDFKKARRPGPHLRPRER